MNNQTPVSKLRAYYEMIKFMDDDDRHNLKTMLGISDDDEKRLVGFRYEDEFKLMMYLLGWVKEFTGIDEDMSPLTGTKTTDFFVDTIQGRQLCIEVKSSKGNSQKFSLRYVREKRAYAKKQHRELYFAINLRGHWMLFSDRYVLEHNRIITFEENYVDSELNDIFGERLFVFPKGLEIVSTYSHSKEGIGINHPEYGNLIRIAIKAFGKPLYRKTLNNHQDLLTSFVLENVEDEMSIQHQEVKIPDADRTLVIERFEKEYTILKLSAFSMSPIRHMTKGSEEKTYTFETFLEEMKTESLGCLSREIVLAVLTELDKQGYPITMIINKNFSGRMKDLQINQ